MPSTFTDDKTIKTPKNHDIQIYLQIYTDIMPKRGFLLGEGSGF